LTASSFRIPSPCRRRRLASLQPFLKVGTRLAPFLLAILIIMILFLVPSNRLSVPSPSIQPQLLAATGPPFPVRRRCTTHGTYGRDRCPKTATALPHLGRESCHYSLPTSNVRQLAEPVTARRRLAPPPAPLSLPASSTRSVEKPCRHPTAAVASCAFLWVAAPGDPERGSVSPIWGIFFIFTWRDRRQVPRHLSPGNDDDDDY
jgi:hypothetical protein